MSLRKIQYKNFILTGLKTPLFQYEILLPDNYFMIYGGYEDKIYLNGDLDYNIIKSNKFSKIIRVFNLYPKYTGWLTLLECFDKKDTDVALDIYKTMCASGSNFFISFDEENKIKNIGVMYNVDDQGNVGIQSLFNNLYQETNFIARKEY